MRLQFTRTAPLALVLSVSFSVGCNYYGDCDRTPYGEPDPCFGTECPRERLVDAGHLDAGPRCTSREDCPGGRACIAGACSPGIACSGDADCSPGERCDASGVCMPVPSDWCAETSDCPADRVCVEHRCRALDAVCHGDVDCGAGRGCIDNACRPLCTSDVECAAGECLAGHCNPTLQCDLLHDCPSGSSCLGGRCALRCLDASQCGADERCASGLCVPDVAPRPFCASDADCAAGHPCLNGVCRTLCPGGTLEECQRSDAQFVSCASLDEALLCLMRSEVTPECITPSDCASGERCIDALCF